MKFRLCKCPQCDEIPQIGYACGEYFVFSLSKPTGCCLCSSFFEMHATEEREILAWNTYCKEVKLNDSNLPRMRTSSHNQ